MMFFFFKQSTSYCVLFSDWISDVFSSDLVTLIGSWTFSTVGLAECATFIADRGIEVDDLFTHRWTLDQADEAYKLFDRQTSGKGVFLMRSEERRVGKEVVSTCMY